MAKRKWKTEFKKGDQVMWHPGNWHYVVHNVLGKGKYKLECTEEDCDDNAHESKVGHVLDHKQHITRGMPDIMDYDQYCDHLEDQENPKSKRCVCE